MPEADWYKLRGHGDVVQHGVVALFGFGGRDIADWFEKPSVVEPVDPFERCELDGFKGSPWSAPVDHLGLVKAIDRFGQSIVIAVADASDRWFNAGLGKALGVFDRDILAATIAVMDQPAAMNWPPVVQSLLEGIEHKAGMRSPADPPVT